MSLGLGELAIARSAIAMAGRVGQTVLTAGRQASAAIAAQGESFAQILAADSQASSTASRTAPGQAADATAGAISGQTGDWLQPLRDLIRQTLQQSATHLPDSALLQFHADGSVEIDSPGQGSADGWQAVETDRAQAALACEPKIQHLLGQLFAQSQTSSIQLTLGR